MKNKIVKPNGTRTLRRMLMGAAAGMVACTSFCGCENFLSGEPEIAYTVETLFDDTLKLSMASLGVYESLASVETYGRDLVLADCGEDLVSSKKYDGTDRGATPEQVGCYSIQVNSGAIYAAWRFFYQGVNAANVVINSSRELLESPNAKINKAARKYVAEARTLRAFYYMDIVRRWGDAPLRTMTTDVDNHNSKRVPREEIYQLIFKDLQEAVLDLPWHDEDSSMSGRVTKGTALGLLVRAYLCAGGYSLQADGVMRRPENYLDYYRKAELYSRELLSSGKHALNPSYESIFKNLTQNIPEPRESMFAIDFSYPDGDKAHYGCIGSSVIGVEVKGNTAVYNVSPSLRSHYFAYKKFYTGDLRRGYSIADYNLNGEKFDKKPIEIKQSASWGIAKWRRDWHIPAPVDKSYTAANYVMLRYSEVLLMRAELLNELFGPTEEAIELANQVRRRGYGIDINTPSPTADVPAKYRAGKEVFFDFLTEEYAREFLGEHGRKFHLIRWNLLKQKLDEVGDFFDNPDNKPLHGLACIEKGGYLSRKSFVSGQHELWPIPYNEIVNSDGFLTENNPGY